MAKKEKNETAATSGDGRTPGDEAARTRAMRSKLIAAAFGEIVSVLMRSPHYKHYSLTDLEWLVVPPLLNNQFSLAEAHNKEGGFAAPVGVALWASVSEEVDQRLTEGVDRPVRLRPDEWRSGDILWMVDAVGAPQTVNALLERLGSTIFQNKPFKVRAVDKDGKRSIKVVQAGEKSESEGEA